ncbi:MAG: MFS transporter [Clostridiales bacterium]|nr:MFS transporter [Clostridiales bacterium]
MSTKTSNGRQHYAWKIMFACIMIKIGSSAVTGAAMGNFITPIVNELGCQVSQLTMFVSIEAVAMALLYTTAAKVLTTRRIGFVMGIAVIAETCGVALMSTYHSVYMFYFSGALIGVAQAFTGFVAMPIVINMWFHKRAGAVLGTVVAVGSGAGIFYSFLSARLITACGWRNAYLIMAAMGAVITILPVFLLIKSPQEAGCRPYGEDEEESIASDGSTVSSEWGLTRKQAFGSLFLYVAWAACLMYIYGSGVSGYIVTYTTMELGQTINFGSYAGIALAVGTIGSSLILGQLNDRFSVVYGLTWGAATTTVGYLLMLLSKQSPMLVLPGAFIVGLGASMYTVQCPLLARSIVGSKNYSEIWAIMMMANSLIGGGLYSSIGLFYDRLGSYRGAFVMGMLLYIGAFLTGACAVTMSKKQRKKLGGK